MSSRLASRNMEPLSGLDASFLYLESPSQPLHVCSILELDTSTMPGGYTFDRFRDELMLRIEAMPQFREKLADSQLNLDHPVWVEDSGFDVDRHLHRIGLPPPGGRTELAEICGHIASLPLQRDRPLWEMWVIEGAADPDADQGQRGRLTVMIKVHHAAADGVTSALLLAQLCTGEPDAPPPDPVDGPGDAGALEIAASGLLRFASRPLRLANLVPTTISTIVNTIARAGRGHAMAPPFAGPPTSFNASVTGHRRIGLAALDLGDIKSVKNRFHVTVNDVVMALCAGSLRRFLLDRGAHGVVAGPDSTLQSQPANATLEALRRDGLDVADLDLAEINEAFAAVAVQSMRDLKIDEDKVNVDGGAIAMGHPLGMSGARLVLHLALELKRRGGGVGAASLCGGGGQGDALVLRVPKQ